MSLRTRIFLLVMLTTLVPAAAIGLYLFRERDLDIDEAKDNIGALAKYATDNLDDKVKGTLQLLHGLSHAHELNTTDRAACSDFLANVLARYPQYTGLLTITPDGDIFCDSLRTGRKLNVGGRDYFKQVVLTHEPAYDVVVGGLTGIAVLQVAHPVLDSHGTLKFVLLGSLNLSQFAQSLVAASQYPNLNVLLWNRNGVLMVRKPDGGHTDFIGKEFASSELFRFAVSGETGTTTDLPDLDGVRRVWALGVMPEHGGARITLGVSHDALLAEANNILFDALLFLIVVSLLAFTGAWFVAEMGIRRHVQRIAIAARRIGTDDAGKIGGPPYPRGELGELMAVVDRTAEAVQAQQSEIKARSHDLQKLNRTLRMLSGINTLIVRVHNCDELFKEACRIAVKEGEFRMATLFMIDRNSRRLVLAASAGIDEGFLTAMNDKLSSGSTGAIIAQVISESRAVVSMDVMNDARILFAKQYAASGVHSLAMLPLIVSGETVGILALYSSESDFFQAEEMKMVTELSGDIAFAIDHIDKQERLDYLSYYDTLTGLANRSLFLERTAQYMRSASSHGHKLALSLIDLERFKNINDSLGRQTGDALLKQVTEWLTRNLGDANLLARIDADHFAVVVPEIKQEGNLSKLCEKTAQAFLSHPFRLNDAVFRIAAKAGIAIFPDDGTDVDTLYKNAEAALKMAKASGERYLFHTRKMTETVAGKLNLENQLRQALDNEEFVLHYQPKINLLSGKLTGVEALIRWNDPRTGLVPPGRFIPILEETGLINNVGHWALRQAVKDHLHWREAGLAAVRIAVNVSALQLHNHGFITEIKQAIAIDDLAPHGLELEITESLIMADVQRSIVNLQTIRDMGVTITIDDFGTGFSSLSYLAKLPVDTLKIDRSFVTDMTAGPEGLALVSTIITLAHSMKLKVVAEGVESEEQANLLRSLSCDEMQGYLFSKPVPREILETRFLTLPQQVKQIL